MSQDQSHHTIAIAHAIPIMDLNNSHDVTQNSEDVDGAFRKFVNAVGSVPLDERANKINSLLAVLPPNEAEKYSDVIQALTDTSARKKPKTEQ
jgi:hypothetical protein